jgi:transcriptional regulator with XRE-family HTH domain
MDPMLADALSRLIEEKGSQHALAQEMGVTDPYISNVKKGICRPSNRLLRMMGLREVKTVTFTYVRSEEGPTG